MEQVSKAVEKKIQEYLEKPSKFTSGESTDFHNYLTKEKGLTKSQANSIVTGIECCNKKSTEIRNEDFKTICKALDSLSECALMCESLKKEWQEAGKKYFNVLKDRVGSITPGVLVTPKNLHSAKLLMTASEMELNQLAYRDSLSAQALEDDFVYLGIEKNKYDVIFDFYERIAKTLHEYESKKELEKKMEQKAKKNKI